MTAALTVIKKQKNLHIILVAFHLLVKIVTLDSIISNVAQLRKSKKELFILLLKMPVMGLMHARGVRQKLEILVIVVGNVD